jgi:hypothetical protein
MSSYTWNDADLAAYQLAGVRTSEVNSSGYNYQNRKA